MIPLLLGGALAAGAIALVAYLLWPTWGAAELSDDPARLPVSIGGTLFNVPTAADPHEDPAPFRTAGTRRSRLRLSVAGAAGSAEACQRRHRGSERCSRSTGSSCRSRRITTRWRRRHCVRTIYPRYLEPAATPAQDGLTMRAFRDGTPYGSEDLFVARQPRPQRPLHPRGRYPRNVPQRAPHRRRRSDVPLSTTLARALARGGRCDGPG